jgi:hypothetical protein
LGLEKIINDIDENMAKEFYKTDEIFTIIEDLEESENAEGQK